MGLEPESIRNSRTTAVDETWAARLAILKYEQLRINFSTEQDITKLELWLEMFGLDPEVVKQGLTTDEYRKILQNVLIIFRLSGTPKSIELIAQALGAQSTKILYKYVLKLDGTWNLDGSYYLDSGGLFSKLSITVQVTGVSPENQEAFSIKLKNIFNLFEPAVLYLQGIEFTDYAFPLQFPIILL